MNNQQSNQNKNSVKEQTTEFYNLSERLLNSGDAYWGNLGFWEYANDYSMACEALAHQLAIKVNLSEHSRILDAGFGCGDQLLLWLEKYRVEFLCGVNYSVSQTQLAKQRLINSENTNTKPEFLIQGDVTGFLNPSSWSCSPLNHENVNTVLALDCAYHFPSRKRFFTDSFDVLNRSVGGGSIGLTDIVLAETSLSWGKRLILNSMLNVSRIPTENIITLTEYHDQLQQVGFEEIESQDISEHVFEPFGDWLTSSGMNGRKLKGNVGAWLKYKVTATFLAWAFRKQVLRYIVISARA
jgi:cyclopropane fatty-acyl-phospholipid synthase-like methyltransferase